MEKKTIDLPENLQTYIKQIQGSINLGHDKIKTVLDGYLIGKEIDGEYKIKQDKDIISLEEK